jgi:hypothetical protein
MPKPAFDNGQTQLRVKPARQGLMLWAFFERKFKRADRFRHALLVQMLT